jgi:hypothetical protein
MFSDRVAKAPGSKPEKFVKLDSNSLIVFFPATTVRIKSMLGNNV